MPEFMKAVPTTTDTREVLIRAAKSLFADKGYDGTTVKDIADGAGLNISLISYHFRGKEGIYRTCLETMGKARLDAAQRILKEPHSAEEFQLRLEIFVEEFLRNHLEEPEVCRIVTRECDLGAPIAGDIFRNTFLKVYETLVQFFKTAQKKRILKKGMDVEIVTGLFFGGILHLAQKDKMNEKFLGQSIRDPKYLNKVIRSSVAFCLQGCLAHLPSEMTRINQIKMDCT